MTSAETDVISRPILFNGPMVRSLLSGKKCQTRRPVVVKTSDTCIGRKMLTDLSRAFADHGFPTDEEGNGLPMDRWSGGSDPAPESCYRNHYLHVPFVHPEDGWEADPRGDMQGRVYCPLGAPGDLLYVRETSLCAGHGPHGQFVWAYKADGVDDPDEAARLAKPGYVYNSRKWRPSIHMLRIASRITLEITSVRVERLQDISIEDAKKEGLSQITKDNGRTWKWGIPDRDGLPGTDNTGWPWPDWEVDARKAFARLWDSVYGKTEHSWAENPWAWRVSFRRLESPNS